MSGVFIVPENVFKIQTKQRQSCVVITKNRGREQPMVSMLVVENDKNLNYVVCFYLRSNGFGAIECLNAKEAYEEIYHRRYKLVISDIMMPRTDGLEFAKNVRDIDETIPILFMSARDDLPSKQGGFQLGIDDYMMRSVELGELLLRIRALPRRVNIEIGRCITVGSLELDTNAMAVFIDGEGIPTMTREFHVLYKLLSCSGETFSRAQSMGESWGVNTDNSLWAVDMYIAKLWGKSSQCSGFRVGAIRGIGYKAVLR